METHIIPRRNIRSVVYNPLLQTDRQTDRQTGGEANVVDIQLLAYFAI
jgi:hypothetical protein